MTKNAKTFNQTITLSPDGKRYARWNIGKYIAPTLTVSGWGQTANGAIDPSGPITGPTPLAIFCHAIGTESSNSSLEPFREDGYHFDFGYGNVYSAGTWTHSGKPKGQQIGGPVAAHVYETPGTYILSLRVKDPTGNSFDLKTKIVAIDANNYWTSDGKTSILLANASTSVWPTWANNTRYLLEAGKDYRRLGAISMESVSNVCIQNYGVDGKIGSFGSFSGGTGYTNGTYTNVYLWRGTGTGAKADITVSGTAVTAVSISNPGKGYVVGDSLIVYEGTGGELGSSGSGFSVNVATIINETDTKPIVDSILIDSNGGSTSPKQTKRIVINKLDANSAASNSALYGRISSDISAEDVLFYKIDALYTKFGTLVTDRFVAKGGIWPRPRRNFLYECKLDAKKPIGGVAGSADYSCYAQNTYEFASLGSTFANSEFHCMRIAGTQYAFIAHNHLYQPGTNVVSVLTIRTNGIGNLTPTVFDYVDGITDSSSPATRYVVAADNKLGNTTDTNKGTWQLTIGAQNETDNASLEYVITERSYHVDVPLYDQSVFSIMRGCRQITVRDAIYQNANFTVGVSASPGWGAAPKSWTLGPYYSNQFIAGEIDNANTFSTPTAILPPRPIANVEASLIARGWGKQTSAGGSIVGPAPLVVFFDAVGTRSANANTNTFRDFGYHFDFGYDSANAAIIGNWTFSGKPKANQIGGPMAAHMYEIPGTYRASVRAQNPQGEYQDKYVTIVVQDANTIYSETKTILVSNNASTDAAYPSAAVWNVTASGAVTFQSDRRYLFKAGQDFRAYTHSLTSNVSRFQIGSFGSGEKPLIKVGNNGFGYDPTDKPLTAGIVQKANLSDMSINYAYDFHFNDCERHTTGSALFSTRTAQNQPNANNRLAINCGIWNSRYYANSSGVADGGVCTYFGKARYGTYIGNDPFWPGEHIYRSAEGYKCIIAHNRLNEPQNSTKNQMKIYGGSGGNLPQSYPTNAADDKKGVLEYPEDDNISIISYYPNSGFETRYYLIADNVVPACNNNWNISIQPQNDGQDERLRDIIVERVVYESNPGATNGSQKAVTMTGQNIVVRDLTIGTRLTTNHFGIGSQGNFVPFRFRGPYYIPAPHPDIGAANNVFASVTGILPNKAGT